MTIRAIIPDPRPAGFCAELPLAVFDKYFFASASEHPFENYTARAICADCPVREACLLHAVTFPGVIEEGTGVRGGISASAVQALRRRYFLAAEDPVPLVRQVLRERVPWVGGSPALHAGRFPDATVLGAA